MAKQSGAKRGGVAAQVENLVRPAIESLGLRLWDVRYEKEGAEWYLKVLIDRDQPMDTDTCELASKTIDPILDEADPIQESYYLEVGSPGIGRKLARPEHYAWAEGQKVKAKLYKPHQNGKKEITGILKLYHDGFVDIQEEQSGEVISLDIADISTTKLCDDEGLF